MKKILVHNFTRLGDLLQSTPLLMGLKEQDPSCTITVTVHQWFQEVCQGFPCVDEVISFDTDGLKEAIVRGGEGLLQGYRYVKSYVELLKERRFDVVFNLSHSRPSSMLLAQLGIPQISGSVADRTGALYTMHPWANYFKNMALHRTIPAFNLVDVYRRMGDVAPGRGRLVYEVPPSAQASVERFLDGMADGTRAVREPPLLIGFQPGASEHSRQWPVSAFAALGKALCTELGARIIVFGTKKEAPLGEEIVKACQGGALSVMGETSLAQLAALVQRCRLLVTNDTGTMHLACAVGTQVVALFMGPALFHQTGPYGAGHIVLQAEIPCAPCNYLVHCTHHVCKEHVRVDAVLQTVKWAIEGSQGPGTRGQGRQRRRHHPTLGQGWGGISAGSMRMATSITTPWANDHWIGRRCCGLPTGRPGRSSWMANLLTGPLSRRSAKSTPMTFGKRTWMGLDADRMRLRAASLVCMPWLSKAAH